MNRKLSAFLLSSLLLATAALIWAPAASASTTKCSNFAFSKDYQGTLCMVISGTGLHTNYIEGTYNGIPLENYMELYINGHQVEKWAFHASDTSHTFATGKNHTWPGTTSAKVCLSDVFGAGQFCTDTASIHA
jgi:hypothetical protein